MNGTPPRSRPVWPWLLGGCLFMIAVAVLGAIYVWRVGVKKMVSSIEERAKNPQLRAEKARDMLRAKKLPDGYYPISATFDFPFITHVRLSDRAPDDKGRVLGYDERGFIYTESPRTDSTVTLEKFFSGGADAPTSAETIGVRLRGREEVARGAIDTGGQQIRYRVVRGHLEEDNDVSIDGLLTLMLIDCSGDKERIAVWFGPEGSEVADENAIRTFMSHFELCRARK